MTQTNPSASRPQRLAGAALIAFAIYFNVPFSLLAGMFDYPDILRRPAADILQAFAAGGAPLLAVWYLFALAAIAFIPVALLLRNAIRTRSGQPSTGLAVAGVLAGLLQALGLIRWVFVVPVLAAIEVDPTTTEATREAARVGFSLLHQYAGVALGEHLGQLLTASWVAGLGWLQLRAGGRVTGALGLGSGLLIFAGLTDGFATVLPIDFGILVEGSVWGFILLTAWFIATGISLITGARSAKVLHTAAPIGR